MKKVELSKGVLAVHEFGDANGEALLFCHGWPASGRQACMLDAAAKAQGFKVIAPDRPGIGASQFVEGRCVADWPEMASELMDACGYRQFAVLGVSGGGPYALACASAIPERLSAAAVVCGAPPIAELEEASGLHAGYRALLAVYRRYPQAVRRFFAMVAPVLQWPDSARLFPSLRFLLPIPDAEVLADPELFAAIYECNVDAFRDVDGVFADAVLYSQAWGFAVEKISVPMRFWHGREDANFYWGLAEQLSSRVCGAEFCVLEETGHFSAPIRHAEAILSAMREDVRRAG